MKKLFALASMMTFGAGLALADLTGNGSTVLGGPGDPFLFGFSANSAVDLNVTDANNNSYTFSTDFAEIGGFLNQGWWSPNQTNADLNTNYIVGSNGSTLFNDYFTFNMDQNVVSGAIVSATLSIPTTGTSFLGLPVTYSVGSVSDSAQTLANKDASPNASIYADLGTSNYGSIVVASAADYTDPLNIALNANAIADLNAVLNTRDYFSIGGTLSPAPVPEPVSFVLLGTVAAIFLRRIRRNAVV